MYDATQPVTEQESERLTQFLTYYRIYYTSYSYICDSPLVLLLLLLDELKEVSVTFEAKGPLTYVS